MSTLVLAGGRGPDGDPVDLRVDDRTGLVVDRAPALVAGPGEAAIDANGLVLLPAPAEPHVHLDKVDTAWRLPNPSGELMDAVAVWMANVADIDQEEATERAIGTIDDYVANGCTAIRTHVDLKTTSSLVPLKALLAARAAVADRCTVQIACLVLPPLSGDSDEARANVARIHEVLELGVGLVGGAPHLDPDGPAAIDRVAALAAEAGVGLDLHIDETLDPTANGLSAMADAVVRHGLEGRATAGHCVSLSMQPADHQERVAKAVAEAGISVVALPATNLWLQARSAEVAPPRGLTAVRRLLDAGVNVASGSDNLRDPFCPIGRADPVEAATLLAVTGHLSLAEAWHAVSTGARQAMGLPTTALAVGDPADVLALAGRDLPDAVARGSARRIVIGRGRVVVETSVRSVRTAPG